jgi:hypothetical protein
MASQPANVGMHWQAPTTITLSYAASLAFAIGHHFFYKSLDQLSVDENLFNQQTNIAIGTAFAFLFRANLVLATCTAYWQVFWATALRNTLTISSMDALAGVLGSLLDFMSVKTFLLNPGLTVLALLAWLVPFAALLPPATLSVISAAATNNSYAHVPVPYFADVSMAAFNYQLVAGDKFSGLEGGLESTKMEIYLKPTLKISRLATTTAYQGAVPDHRTAYPNSTYEVQFNAPAVQCRPVSQDIMRGFNRAAGCNFTRTAASPRQNCSESNPYIAWVPEILSLVPFSNGTLRKGLLPLDDEMEYLTPLVDYSKSYLGSYQGGPASVFVATRRLAPPVGRGWDVLNCSLFNASYTVHESSDSNRQSEPRLSELRILDSVPFTTRTSRKMSEQRSALDATLFSYHALMQCLNRLLVGSIVSDYEDPEGLPYLDEDRLKFQNQNLMATLLAFSTEIVPYLTKSANKGDSFKAEDLQSTIIAEVGESTISLPNEALESSSFNKSIASGIEQIFQNFTLALFNDARFLRDSEDPVNITVSYTRNVYSYSSRNLLLSYGIALSLTLLASLAGCLAIFFNRASYTNKFSTIMRTTAGFEDLVHETDRTGADPLPKHLARARIHLGHREGEMIPEVAGERRAMMDRGRGGPKAPEVFSQRSVSSIT